MAKAPWTDPRLEEGMQFGGKTNRPAAPSFPDRPMHPQFGRPQFPQEPRDPWPWISLVLSIAALAVSVLVWFRT